MRRRMSFVMHLQNSNSALTTYRYLRLMAMAVTEMFWGTALTAFNIYSNFSYGFRPWISWQNVHSNFSRVDLYPTIYLSPSFLRSVYLFWWAMPVSAFIFFLFFGFGEEARKEYSKAFSLFRVYVFRLPVQPTSICSTNTPSTRWDSLNHSVWSVLHSIQGGSSIEDHFAPLVSVFRREDYICFAFGHQSGQNR